METNLYQFEFLTLDQQKLIIEDGKFIDTITEGGFKIHLFFCEKSYYVEAYTPVGESEIDFISLIPDERLGRYKID
jgi:hypothetical protein